MSSRVVTFAPPREQLLVALGGAVLVVALTAFGSVALPLGLLGLVLLAVGVRRGASTLTNAGSGLLVAAVVVGGFGGVPPIPTLVAGVVAAVVWDASTDVAVCTNYETDSGAVLTRIAGVGLGSLLAAVWVYVTYRLARGGRPTVALLALVTGGLVLTAGLSRAPSSG